MKLALASDGATVPSDVIDLLAAAGLPTASLRSTSGPALIAADGMEWLVASGEDVLAVCVAGGVDAGIVGKELLLEHELDLSELLDLQVASQRLVYAKAASGTRPGRHRLRIATRYPRATRRHFAQSGRQVDPLTLAAPGLAVELGLADGVVELEHLLPRGEAQLVVCEQIALCGARLVAGRQARALRSAGLSTLVDSLRAAQVEI